MNLISQDNTKTHTTKLSSYDSLLQASSNIQSNDTAVIIYTSGTTGNPKGVVLTHRNITTVLKGTRELWHEEAFHHISLAFLPWAHVFGQVNELHSMIATGSSMAIVPNRELILHCLQLVKPTIILSVPMLFNKIYDSIMSKLNNSSIIRKSLVFYALSIARQRNHILEYQDINKQSVPILIELQYQFFNKIIFEKIRNHFGGRIRFFASGGAAVSKPILEFFEDIGLPICEGYGLTETSPVISSGVNNWKTRRLGCCGVPLPNISVLIADIHVTEGEPSVTEKQPSVTEIHIKPSNEVGEIIVSGDNVMEYYHNNPKATNEVFIYYQNKKYFRTGDLGQLVDGKFLQITGRIKEQYKLENGKYVVPGPLEDHVIRSQFISQAFIYGSNKIYNIALIIPDFIELKQWLIRHHLIDTATTTNNEIDYNILFMNKHVIDLYISEINAACQVMKSYERPKKFLLIKEAFSPENQMLTPKMSLRRNAIMKRYGNDIEDMYLHKIGIDLNSGKDSLSLSNDPTP